MTVIQGNFLQPSDRKALQMFSGEFLYGCPDAISHVMMHIDRIKDSPDLSAQIGICQGIIWAYQRAMILPVSDVKRLESELYKAEQSRRASK